MFENILFLLYNRFVGMVSVTLWETSEDPDVPDVNINEKVAEILKDSDLSPRLPAVCTHHTCSGIL